MSAPRSGALAAVLLLSSCVAGSKIRADAEVIAHDVERAKRSGAIKCAPRELAAAEANRDFAVGELDKGNNFRAQEHIKLSEENVKRALELSKGCAPKQILVREKDIDRNKPNPVVVKIEITDSDGDGIPDKDDKCPNQAEDKDGFQDEDGCPDLDNDNDGVLDANDRCPNDPGPMSNQGCPVITPKDRDGDGIPDDKDKCPDQPEDKDGFQDEDGCPDLDNDNDGVTDAIDRCPDEPGPASNQGCPVHDRDGDGIPDNLDKCPDEPEDKDGFEDQDGCPDLDNDKDGIPDSLDSCPNEPGPLSNKGCPVRDRDGDGIPDDKDKCPDQPEDKDGFQDEDGCPDPDNDNDGIPDGMDFCPNMPGPLTNKGCPVNDRDGDGIPDNLDKCPDKPGPAETDGCPDIDTDGDGIPDRLDACPKEYGVKEEHGCPKKYKMVVVKKDRIEIKKQIKFKSGSGVIIGTESFDLIKEMAQAMRDNPQIKKLRVEGHTDSVGNDAANLKLSQKRADSVMSALIKEGIDPGRMEAVGFGETRPIASNGTAKGRAENRRTEFNIIEQ